MGSKLSTEESSESSITSSPPESAEEAGQTRLFPHYLGLLRQLPSHLSSDQHRSRSLNYDSSRTSEYESAIPNNRHFLSSSRSQSIGSEDNMMHDLARQINPIYSHSLPGRMWPLSDDILSEERGECAICLEDMQPGDIIARLPCFCIYHKWCLDKWFEKSRTCPEHPDN